MLQCRQVARNNSQDEQQRDYGVESEKKWLLLKNKQLQVQENSKSHNRVQKQCS